jgi:hypothetical protein
MSCADPSSTPICLLVLRRSALQTAPDAVFFRASVTYPGIAEARSSTEYDESHHRLRYTWDFCDPGAASDKVVNLPTAHNDLDTAYGKEVAHIFRRPGRYRVTCRIDSPDGFVGAAELEVLVKDPNLVFAGAQTILVDPDGLGDPAWPQAQMVRDWDTALAAAAGNGRTRLLLRRGQRYSLFAEQRLTRRHGSVHIGAFGTGLRPELRSLSGRAMFEIRGSFDGTVTVQGLDLRGPWDAAAETGARIDGLRIDQGNRRTVILDDCTFSGFGTGILITGSRDSPDEGLFAVHDCAITNWGNYGLLASPDLRNHIAILGSAIYQHPQAMQGGQGKDGFSHNEHGPVRIAGAGHFHMDVCDLFSRTGWTRLDGVPADQSCLRWNTKALPGSSGTVSRCAMEGGLSIVALRDENANGDRYLSNFVLEKCLLVGSASTIIGVSLQFTGQTVRNNIIIMPDVPSAAIPWQAMIVSRADVNPEGQRDPAAPVAVYANTLIQRRSDAHHDGPMDIERGMAEFAVFSFENNLFYTPNNTTQRGGEPGLILGGGPLETVGGVWRSRFAGLKYQPEQPVMDDRFATPPGQLRDVVPAPGTPKADDAMGMSALDDFFGRLRGETPDRGAIET